MGQKIITSTGPHGTTAVTTQQKIKVWMQVVVSLLLLLTGILVLTAPNYVLRHDFDEATKRFAAGWIGAIIGYWLS